MHAFEQLWETRNTENDQVFKNSIQLLEKKI